MERALGSLVRKVESRDRDAIVARGAGVIRIEAEALEKLAHGLDGAFADACELMLGARGRVVITGMGKSGHIGRKAAATLSATGTPATYVHPGEAAHGDLGMLVRGDVLVVISNSGNTAELQPFLRHAALLGVPVIGIASRANSLVMRHAQVGLVLPEAREACAANIAPTTSTTLQLALCDALAMAVMDMRGFSRDRIKQLHPGGMIGLRLMPVRDMMHAGDGLPLADEDTPMRDVITIMTSRGFGIAGIVDEFGQLVGVVTDGDLRRHFDELGCVTAREVMTTTPKVLEADMSAEVALEFLNDLKITAAFVVKQDGFADRTPLGVVHIHDFLRVGLS